MNKIKEFFGIYEEFLKSLGPLSDEPIIIRIIPISETNIPNPDVKLIFSLKNNIPTKGTKIVVPASHNVSTALKSE